MFRKPKPSSYIRRYLEGDGLALDDLLSRHDGDPEYDDAAEQVMLIWSGSGDHVSDYTTLMNKLVSEGR